MFTLDIILNMVFSFIYDKSPLFVLIIVSALLELACGTLSSLGFSK